jgi:hypothetical protein
MVNGKTYLDEVYQTYCKLIENSNLVKKNMQSLGGEMKSGKGIIKNINMKQILTGKEAEKEEMNERLEDEKVNENEKQEEKEDNVQSVLTIQNAEVDLESGVNIEITEIIDENKPKRKYNKKVK